MPSHWGHKQLNIVSQSSPTGTQCLQAVGCAEAGMLYERVQDIPDRTSQVQGRRGRLRLGRRRHDERRRVLGIAHDRVRAQAARASSSSKTTATRSRSRSKSRRRAANISKLVESFPGLERAPLRRHRLSRQLPDDEGRGGLVPRPQGARARARDSASVPIRTRSRTTNGSTRRRPSAPTKPSAIRSPKFARVPQVAGLHHGRRSLTELAKDVDREIGEAADAAIKAPKPSKDTAGLWVYSPDVDPTSSEFDTAPQPEGKPDTMVAAINRTMKDEMAVNPRIVVFGEDVADATHAGNLSGSPGQGRRLQGHARTAEGVRPGPRVQLAARRSQHRRARRRHGDARHQAGRRDPVLRLHLAGDDAAPQRSRR